MASYCVPACQQVVQPQSSSVKQARRPAVHGNQEGLRRDQMRSQLEHRGPLAQRLTHQMKFQLLQITQAAVYELRVLAAGPRGEMPLLNQPNLDAAQRQIAGNARAVDAAADNQNVEPLAPQAFEIPGPALPVECWSHSIAAVNSRS